MSPKPRILTFVLAGGEGQRLRPLTDLQPKPVVPVVDGYLIIDFVLSNLLNSGVTSVYVLGQYRPRPLVEHVEGAWRGRFHCAGGFVRTLLPPRDAADGFKGTADAVHQYMALVREHEPDLVAVFAADHVYRMDVQQMARDHLAQGAEVTVAATPVPLAWASSLGVIAVDEQRRIVGFDEKPEHPAPIPGNPACAYGSMGNYLFAPAALERVLQRCHDDGGHDFGRHVMPALPTSARAYGYDFSANRVPGLRLWEDPAYWRDVGSHAALMAARDDVVGAHPRIDLSNPQWPIHKERRRSSPRRAPRFDAEAAGVVPGSRVALGRWLHSPASRRTS